MKTSFVFFCLSSALLVCCHPQRHEHERPPRFECGTYDVVFIDSTRYLMDRSPLSSLEKYDELPMDYLINEVFPSYPGGTMGEFDKTYSAVWLLDDSTLYLCALDYIQAAPKVGSRLDKDYRIMEKFLDRRFEPMPGIPIPSAIESPGLILADWVSGPFYVKRANDVFEVDADSLWHAPFSEMVFENGRMISSCRLTTQPYTEKELSSLKNTRRNLYLKEKKNFKRIIKAIEKQKKKMRKEQD